MEYPKKKKSNVFFNFMKSQQRENPDCKDLPLTEVMNICDPLWKSMSKEERADYKGFNEERTERFRHGGYDSFGRPLEDVLNREDREMAEIEKMKNSIVERINNALVAGNLETMPFYILHFNIFCVTEEGVPVPAEIAVARFTLKDGVKEIFHDLIDPGVIPTGYRADCMENSKATHQIPLDLVHLNQNYHHIMDNLLKFLGLTYKSQVMPPLYCHPKHSQTNSLCLHWLFKKIGFEDPIPFSLQQLPMLLYELVGVKKSQYDMVLPTINMAEVQLDRDVFLYTPGMGCWWHESDTEVNCCASALVRRWSYIMADFVCPRYNLPMLPGFHAPHAQDEAAVFKYDSDMYSTDISDTASVYSTTSDSEHPLQSWFNQNPSLSNLTISSGASGASRLEKGRKDKIKGLVGNLVQDEDGFSECDSDALGFSSSNVGDLSESDQDKVGFGDHQYDTDILATSNKANFSGYPRFGRAQHDTTTAIDEDTATDEEAIEKFSGKTARKNKFASNRYDTDSTDCEGDAGRSVKKVVFGQARYDSDSKCSTDTSGRNLSDTGSGKTAARSGKYAETLARIQNNKGKKSNYLYAIAQKKTSLIED